MTADATDVILVGQSLPELSRKITQDTINRYAEASGDHNPLHVDPTYAATTQFGGPIAHGMLVLAYLSETLTSAFGERWLKSGRLKARFRGAARPGDTVTISGKVTKVEAGRVNCDIVARNHEGELLVTADAQVTA